MQGGCHCGAVRYEVTGGLEGVIHCHCHTCRKINGTVYGSSGVAERDEFRITKGKDDLTPYESKPGKKRWFCRHCGSHVYAAHDDPDTPIILRVGTLDDDPGIRSAVHIWVSHKPGWYDIDDKLPQHAEFAD